MKVTVTRDDGSQQDITELVRIVYDVAAHSMDAGSGFLDREETNGLLLLAEACGFPDFDVQVEAAAADRLRRGKSAAEIRALISQRGGSYPYVVPTEEEKDAALTEIHAEMHQR